MKARIADACKCWHVRFCGAICAAALMCNGCEPTASKSNPTKTKSERHSAGSGPRKEFTTAIAVEPIGNNLGELIFENGADLGHFTLPEPLGGGSAIVDFDRDGVLDIIGAGGGTVSVEEKKLLGRNGKVWRGMSPFHHVDVTANTRVDLSESYNHGIIASDYDADGFMDFLVTGYEALLLFRNQGDGTFEVTTEQANLDNNLWSCCAAFFDADNDGDLDLYIARYANWSFDNNPQCVSRFAPTKQEYCGLRHLQGMQDSLYENSGDGTFRDVSELIRVDIPSRGLGVMAADFNGDRLVDLYVANDVQSNFLFRNHGSWSFAEVGVRAGVAVGQDGQPEGSMGIALGDYNLDGRFDLWVTNYDNDVNALYRNDGHMSFTYSAHSAKIPATDELTVGWGTFFNDLDLDGDEDLVVANGHLERFAPGSLKQRALILENIEGSFFRLWPKMDAAFSNPQSGRGLAAADFDHDGLVDMIVSRIGDTHRQFRNVSRRQGAFLLVNLIGTSSNRDAIGTTIKLKLGKREFVRHVYGGGSYVSTSDREIHFGIPTGLGSQASLTIAWPSGLDQAIELSNLDQRITIIEGQERWD